MIDKSFIVVLLFIGIIIAAALAFTVLNSPTTERRDGLERDLIAAATPDQDTDLVSGQNFRQMRKDINAAGHLWKPLIPAPPRPKPKAKPPNLEGMLKGVTAPRRTQIGNRIKLITNPGNPRGDYYGVGDEVKGLTIIAIDEDNVEFALTEGGKEYTYKLKRR